MDLINKALESKTFCIYPWIHQYVGPQGEVKPCCLYDPSGKGIGNLKDNSLSDIWNNDITKKMRLDMMNGVEVPGCSMCNNRVGVTKVHRDEANSIWVDSTSDIVNSTLEDGTLPEHKLKYIDARFNNLCNLKCRTCSPHFSTSWHEDYEKMRIPNQRSEYPKRMLIPGNTEEHLLNEIMPHLKEVKKIYFAGGEPLMQIEHYKILEELINLNDSTEQNNQISFLYSTNFSSLNLGKHNAIDYWKKFPKVNVSASLDGSYAKAEYWRKGTDWGKIVKNREYLKKECPHVQFTINFTLSWVNAFNLLELHKEWVTLEYISVNSINVGMLDHPGMYSLKTLPNWKKKQIELAFREHLDWLKGRKASTRTTQQFVDAINFMNDTDNGDKFAHALGFATVNNKLDKIRNENFWEVFPEHADMKEYVNGFKTL